VRRSALVAPRDEHAEGDTAADTARYRWVVLAVGTASQAGVSAAFLGVAVLAPQLREHFGLSLGQTGVVLAAFSIGMTPTLLVWGVLADRVGERIVLPVGLAACAGALATAGFAGGYESFVLLLVVAGAFGASVNAASGRAVMHWFPHRERGLALGIRQANVPLGGLVAALTLPALAVAAGVEGAFVALAAACAVGAVLGAALLREPPPVAHPQPVSRPLRDPDVWRVSFGSGLLLVGQTATLSFTVLYLHNAHDLSTGASAAALAASQVLGVAARIAVGHWSDRVGLRIVPMRQLALAMNASLVAVAALDSAAEWLVVLVLVLAGALCLSWNGLAFTAAAEIAGARASGAAIGLQQTMLGVSGIVAPIGIALLVDEWSWPAAFLAAGLFPLLGWLVFRPLSER
jgi:sugar phosphate permease